MKDRIYLDFNATTPLAPQVAAAMAKCLEEPFGNPSSAHWAGIAAREAVESARSQVASLLGCNPTEVVFTSGGTEANNHAIKGLFFALDGLTEPFHMITSQVEHASVLEPCEFLERLGAQVTRLPVDRFGVVDPDDVRRAIRPSTSLISIMHANNEVGTIQLISEIAAIAREYGIVSHTDAAQTVGKIPVDVESLGVDLLSVAGHKLYGPKGVGALFVRKDISLESLLHGAGHEGGRRAGTENLLEIVGLGAACELALSFIDNDSVASLASLRDSLWHALQRLLDGNIVMHGHPQCRLPNTLNVSFRVAKAYQLLDEMPNVAASTGSACHSGSARISPVLEAMGVSNEIAQGAIRFSLGRTTTQEDIDALLKSLSRCHAIARAILTR